MKAEIVASSILTALTWSAILKAVLPNVAVFAVMAMLFRGRKSKGVNNPGLGTTPVLEEYLTEYLVNSFGNIKSLLSGIDMIPDKELQAFKNPTIFDMAKASGYRTILINVQGDFPDLFFRGSDMSRVDEVYLNEGEFDAQTNYMADFNAASFIRGRLEKEKGLFIFLEKMGTHVPYEKRYPRDDPANQIFTPKLSDGEFYALDKRRKVINSYKNALRYNLDGFFSRLFGNDPTSLKDCTIIYTSDHGQSLMEHEYLLYSHTTGEFEQALVPFIIFSTDSFTLENLIRPEKISGTLSHLNIYPTICALLRRDVNYSSDIYSSVISRQGWKNPPLIYFMKGALWDGEASAPASTDNDGKIILPKEKYMY
ncbi:MAG: sulfatase-like hydrolase/transferase [Synergistaceae bacterium]|nr:sulfatase-like hydrolase/transferase [Synergistaceae bacterium]